MNDQLAKLHEMIADLKIAMMTTRRPDGALVSRAMSTQKRVPGADLWFVTREGDGKLEEIAFDPNVNLAFYKDGSKEWISISGLAKISRDRALIRALHEPDWKMWFGEEGDARHGTPDDPRMTLIGVDIQSAVFLEVDKPQPVVLFELAKGLITGKEPELGTTHRLGT